MKNKKINLTQLVFISLMASIMCIAGPLSLPIGPIPVTLTNLMIYIAIYVLGTKYGIAAYCIYLMLGIIGLPVFSGFAGGIGKLMGPTGGYLLGFIVMAFTGGKIMETAHRKFFPTLIGWIAGIIADYFIGTLWFMYIMNTNFLQAVTLCVLPFAVCDIIKIIVGTILGRQLYKMLIHAGYII